MDPSHPLIASVLLPLTVALALTGVLRWAFGAHLDGRPTAAAVGLALLISHLLAFGAPAWPPVAGPDKLPWLFALLLAGGIAVDVGGRGRIIGPVAAVLAAAAMTGWLAWPQLTSADQRLLAAVVAAPVALLCLTGLRAAPVLGAQRAAVLVAVALGLAGASFAAGSLLLFQVSLALAAAVGGFALWSWPTARLPFSASALAVGGLGCLAVALLLLLLTEIRPWAPLPLALIFGAPAICRRLPAPGQLRRETIEPLYILAIGVPLAVLTILLAEPPTSADDPYYR